MRTSSILSVSFIAGAVALMGLGCNPMASVENKVGEKVAEGILNQASGGKVDVKAKEGEYSFTDNKTGATMAVGTDVKIPDTFPKDVLIYAGTKALSVSTSGKDAERGDSITLRTTDDVATVTKWYDDHLKSDGWTQSSSMTANGMEIRAYTKAKAEINFTASAGSDEEKGTIITLTRTESQSNGQ